MKRQVEQEVEKILSEDVRPELAGHLGDIELAGVEGDTVYVRLTGACRGCPSANETLETVVLENLQKKMPEIKNVVLDQSLSDELLDMARTMLHSSSRKLTP